MLILNRRSKTHTTPPTHCQKRSRSTGTNVLQAPRVNLRSTVWPTIKATTSSSIASRLLGTARLIWAISCRTGNSVNARGWKYRPTSRLDSSRPLIFWTGTAHLRCSVLCSKNTSVYISSDAQFVRAFWTSHGLLFSGKRLSPFSFLNSLLFFLHQFFPPRPKLGLLYTKTWRASM